MGEQIYRGDNTIRLSERLMSSQAFRLIYEEGMALVEEAAAYLDDEGRAEAKKLSRIAATLYAAESMRLTTRLMQIASWLLLQRAANNGEMTREQMVAEKTKVRLDTLSASNDAPGWDLLPPTFVDIVTRSLRLQSRVQRMDQDIYGEPDAAAGRPETAANPVSDQLALLHTAFGRR
jgi:regulator of CtrA degradation